MRKRISEMTPEDKEAFLAATIRATEEEQHVPWSWMEAKIQEDIDATWDDARFAKMDPKSGACHREKFANVCSKRLTRQKECCKDGEVVPVTVKKL